MWWSWGGFFDVANRRDKIAQDKQLTLAEGFWNDNARATQILKDIKLNEYWVRLYEQVETGIEDFAVLFDFSISFVPLCLCGLAVPGHKGTKTQSP